MIAVNTDSIKTELFYTDYAKYPLRIMVNMLLSVSVVLACAMGGFTAELSLTLLEDSVDKVSIPQR